MSQSDYIKYKRIQRELKEFNEFPAKIPNVLNARQYTLFKEYALENTIVNHHDTYDKFIDENVPIVFGMVKPCAKPDQPDFILCAGTQSRGNRTHVLALENDDMPRFRFPRNETISKSKRMKWNSLKTTTVCACVHI